MPINRISLITPVYPSPRFRERGAFVENLVAQWEIEAVTVDVIAPVAVSTVLRNQHFPKSTVPIPGTSVSAPRYLTLSNRKVGALDFGAFSRNQFYQAAASALRTKPVADVYYGKFLMTGGAAAAREASARDRPSFADLGESRLLDALSEKDKEKARHVVQSLAGIVCVSERLRDEALMLGADPERILLLPNAPDRRRFIPMDKAECRRQLGLPLNEFLVIFVGNFIERKGPLRALAALQQMKEKAKGIFIGRGNQVPEGQRVLHCGPVPNSELAKWLNAADVMLLPTLAEGSCNAITEALACGLPVISADIVDIRTQVSNNSVILIDPMDSAATAVLLDQLVKKPLRLAKMRDRLLNQQEVKSTSRGSRILDWMSEYV